MRIWLDAQLPPSIAAWIRDQFGVEALPVRDVGQRDALDRQIFLAARRATVVVMTKDRDFADLIRRLGPPPQVIWLPCGNTSNAYFRELLSRTLPRALELIRSGEPIVEIAALW